MKQVQLLDKRFEVSIPSEKIQEAVAKVASEINNDLKDKDVIFIAILNGSFMFASDLYKLISFNSLITFLKLASYEGTSTSGKIKRLIGINEDIKDKVVVVLEDIVDTGNTMESILKQLKGYEPSEIKIATLLLKPEIFKNRFPVDYVGLEIPNEFIVGYGLDYDGFGRNLADIYTVL